MNRGTEQGAAGNGLTPSACAEVFARLDDYLDRELSPDDLRMVDEHLEVCGVCAAEFGFEESVISNLRARVREPALPAGLRQRIEAMLDRAGQGSSSSSPSR